MLQVKNVKKQYRTGSLVQKALDGVSLNLRDNEFVAILGPSGSGKTTLLNVIGGLDRYDSGELIINGLTTKKYKDSDWDYYRNHTIGFVFQSYNLIPHQTLLANVELALTISGISGAERKQRALDALESVGLKEQAHKKPNQLSGGQMQRVAIARALVNDPDIVLADEPTGALDSETSVQVMNLLQEVAKDRLVVMVTHNPELAKEYATRIVTIKDGKLIHDTNPYNLEQKEEGVVKKTGKSSMSFKTALSLSFNNLLTKKARTFLVSAAGSIGIIGIALIMSLSTGANAYIASIEQEAMAEYPLQITSVGYNLASIMTNVSSSIIENAEGAQNANNKDDDTIKVVDTISSMFSGMSDNDLKSLKNYLESDESSIDQYARSIRYTYDVTPSIYQKEDDGYYKVNPSSTSSTGTAMTTSTGGSFNELPADKTLYEDQYMVRAGHWPENSHECVLVLTDGGMVTDTLMYTLGFRDRSEMQEMMQAMQSGQNVDLKEYDETYSYDSFLGMTFKVISPSSTYQYDAKHNVYTSFENDTTKLNALLDETEDMVISGIVQPVPDSDTLMLQTGIYYPASLTIELMEEAQNSDVVKAQLDNPDINVFTGKSFTDENAAESFSMEDLFTVDETALSEAFAIDTSALSMDPSALNFDLSSIDTSNMIDPSALSSALPTLSAADILTIIDAANITISEEQLSSLFTTLIEGYDPSTLEQYSTGLLEFIKTDEGKAILSDFVSSLISDEASAVLSPEALQAMVETIMNDYAQFALTQPDPTDFETNIAAYMQSEQAETLFQQQSQTIVSALVSIEISEENLTNFLNTLSTGYDTYAKAHGYVDSGAIVSSFETYLNSDTVQQTIQNTVSSMVDTTSIASAMTQVLQSSMSSFTNTLSSQISSATTNILQQVSAQLTNSMSTVMSSLSTNMQSMFHIDPEAFANVIKVNMSANEIAEMMSSLMNNTESSYKTNLTTLGYADEDSPEEIDIYPVDFAAKGEITDILDAYNENMQNSNQEDKVIIYADLVAAMMSSVTTIVDTISYVLIAFVAISLIVSSIMIGVITYISVLERRKEIGILRALGASKHNVAQVFNAETFITGLLAGAIGVGVSWLLLIPGNAIIHAIAGNSEINAILPIPNAIALVLLSIILTIIAGLLPSRKAANSDPVTALRTE